ESRGITRYLPTWFKKQKSQVNGHAEEVEEKEEVKSEEVKEATQPESDSNASADTEILIGKKNFENQDFPLHSKPAKEEKVEDATAKSPEKTKDTAVGEGAEEEKKKEPEGHVEAETDGGESQTSIFQSPLRLVRKNKMKVVVCHVTLLEGTDFTCEVEQKRAKGQYLFFKVCEHLNLLEKDYFGLTYKDNHDEKCWLDPTKEIKRQIRSNNWQFAFGVKFYPPDPSQLTEDITRYLLCLQLREDVASGRLPCSFVTHALLGSYTLQAELGDHEPDQPRPLDFISQLTFAPNQNKEMEEKILELHKSHRGMTPAQADLQFLENAKKLSMYGVDLHHAKDSEGVDIMLGVCANGLLVYKDRLRINRFAWPKILKISYKRNNFYIKIRPGETEQFESTVGFKLQNHRSAKRLWKVCVENHSFFRLNAPEPPTKARFLTLGSKFRYSGRTQAQTRLASSLIDRPAPSFERTSSKRISRSLDGASAPVISITEAGISSIPCPQIVSFSLLSSFSSRSPLPLTTLPSTSSGASSPLRVHGDNIYVRHSNLMLEDLDKTQDEVLKHQASISQLKRSFMEAPPPSPPQPNQWEKRLTSSPATIRVQQHQVLLSVDQLKTTEVEIEETVVIQEVSRAPKPGVVTVTADPTAAPPAEHEPQDQKVKVEEEAALAEVEEVSPVKPEKASSDSESEEEAEYHPNVPASISQSQAEVSQPEDDQEEKESGRETEDSTDDPMVTPEEAPEGLMVPEESAEAGPTEDLEQPKMNGEASLVEVDPRPQVICCSEPPVVKTEMVTISDTFAAQKTEIATKEVPIVHTETKTITYEAAQLDGNSDGEPGVLMTAQTITSESLCTTTTTHITKTLKGGLSETRIEKRIVITGDCDIDHDQALAQAIKEAKEQHPDMSVTRVVVHKETELAEEED
uniref:Erythrocyte membrane protein band 4.1 like 2 n=1 Tax=Poecilia formosa TaxID=48698 RepID=A0A096MDN0_POEFO